MRDHDDTEIRARCAGSCEGRSADKSPRRIGLFIFAIPFVALFVGIGALALCASPLWALLVWLGLSAAAVLLLDLMIRKDGLL